MATPMQKEDFERRCKSLVSKLNDADFLANKGLGNEAGIFTFCYDPTLEAHREGFLPQGRLRLAQREIRLRRREGERGRTQPLRCVALYCRIEESA